LRKNDFCSNNPNVSWSNGDAIINYDSKSAQPYPAKIEMHQILNKE